MIFNEQLSKISRILYRGSQYPNWNESLSQYKCFYVTTEPSYALYYATDESTWEVKYITKYFLRRECNLFNANSDKDPDTLKVYLRKNFDATLSTTTIRKLRLDDWLLLKEKEEMIQILKEIGYDGFVNFEHIKNFFLREPRKKLYSFTGIGIFDKDTFLAKSETLQGFESVKNIPKIKQNIEEGLQFLTDFAEDHIDLQKNDLRKLMQDVCNKYLIRDPDIDIILENLNISKIKEKHELQKLRKSKGI